MVHPHPGTGGVWNFSLDFSSALPFMPFLPLASNWLDRQTNQASRSGVRSVKPSHVLQ